MVAFPLTGKQPPGCFCHKALCQMMDSNQRRQSRRIYSPLPLAARAIWHAPFGALVTLLRVAPTYANRLFRTRPAPNQTRALNARHNTPHTRACTGHRHELSQSLQGEVHQAAQRIGHLVIRQFRQLLLTVLAVALHHLKRLLAAFRTTDKFQSLVH